MQAVDDIASRYGFVKEEYKYENSPRQQLNVVKKQLTEISKQQKKLASEIASCSGYIVEFEWTEEILLARAERVAITNRLVRSPYLIIVQGWIDSEEKEDFIHLLQQEHLAEEVYVSFEEPTVNEIAEEVPTKLKNHPIVAPFEMLTEMYSFTKV